VSDPVKQAEIDPVDRLAILAAALPGAAVRQRRIAAPIDAVWQVIADLEHAAPRYEPGVARMHITERHGQRLHLLVGYTDGREEPMDVRLRRGWCLMQSPTVVVAFAARTVGSQTLLAHLEHQRAGAQASDPGRSGQRRAAHAKIDQELHTIERLAVPGRPR
jgi:hypothetical protein